MNLRIERQQIFRFIAILIVLGFAWYLSSIGLLDTTSQPAPEAAESLPTEEPGTVGNIGEFDFYVLALSWSPEYCNSSGTNDPQQCSVGRRLGFVLHGLWPEYDRGYPSDCSSIKLTSQVKEQFPNLYPSPKLYDHEWEKHGTCSGLTPTEYLALSKRLKDSVVIPTAYRAPEQPLRVTVDQLKKEFIGSNVAFSAQTLAVFCSGSGRYLQELQVCFTQDGKPMACSDEILKKSSRSCQAADFLMRNVR